MQGESSCVEIYEEAIQIAHLTDDRTGEAILSFSFGNIYISSSHTNPFFRDGRNFVPVDLDKAEYWFRRSLELRAEIDRLGRARCLNHLGLVTLERYDNAQEANRSNEELLRLLNSALHFHFQALELHPSDAKHDLGLTYSQIGTVYASAGNAERVISNWQQALHYFEAAESFYHAAAVRLNIAMILEQTHRLLEAKDYAYAALSGFDNYGSSTADEVQRVRNLIAKIDEQLQAKDTSS
jgi:tetratricopeptide (TPR) repeat protein